MNLQRRAQLKNIYDVLFAAFGPQHWWPAKTPFEVMVGAILTQNTNWSNVARAIANLKQAKCLSPRALRDISHAKLARLIKPSGYFNIKAKRLKNFIRFLFDEYNGNLRRMAEEDLVVLREKVLGVNGVGPETADSILLYALGKPIFVIDGYTKRVLWRHGFINSTADYHDVQKIFMESFPTRLETAAGDVRFYNEFHALFVHLGAEICRPRPLCDQCPLNLIPRRKSVKPVKTRRSSRALDNPALPRKRGERRDKIS